MIVAPRAPSPNTVWAPTFHRWQPRHPAAARRSAGRVRRAGRKSAALPVELAVLVGVIVLLPVFVEAVSSFVGLHHVRHRRRVFVIVHRLMQLFEKARVRALTMLSLGVFLRSLLLSVAFAHRLLRCGDGSECRTR